MPLALETEVSAILELAPLERFVFVMSVLERYSEHDAALAGALQHLRLMDFHKHDAAATSQRVTGPKTSRLVIDMAISRYFATPGCNPSLPNKRASSLCS